MNPMIRFVLTAAVSLGIPLSGARALPVDPGESAPPFDLQSIAADAYLRSSEIFSTHDYTFLVFWGLLCPHCVEALLGCDRFYREYGGESITVVGVNADEGDPLAARGLIESNGIAFSQARDDGAAVSDRYGVPYQTFTVYLVGRDSRVLSVRFDPQGDVGDAMEKMLMSFGSAAGGSATASPGEGAVQSEPPDRSETTVRDEMAEPSYHGLQRIRFLSIDSRGSSAVGLYGEAVSPRNSLQYRFEVEASKKLTRYLRAGALLRISNEGKKVLDSGPQYLGSEWGSAFAEIAAKGARFRLGYYSISMTPLTLMRWDWDDNPRVGGDAGCGCGAAAGALLVESLEELAPELTVEGALASWGRSNVEAKVFYGIPRRPLETTYTVFRSGVGERARYALEIYGFETRWQRFDERTGSFWKAGVHVLGSAENERSVDFNGLGYAVADSWESTWIASATAEAPLVTYARLRGEMVAWAWREQGIATAVGMREFSRDGVGGIGGIAIEKTRSFGLSLDYLRLDPYFVSPFAALSYEPNTEGLRAAAHAQLPGDFASLSLFHKRLQEADIVISGAGREQISISGASIDFGLRGKLGANAGWLEKRSWRDGAISPSREYRRAIVASLHCDFERIGVLQAQYQRIKSSDTTIDHAIDGEADLYSLYATIYF